MDIIDNGGKYISHWRFSVCLCVGYEYGFGCSNGQLIMIDKEMLYRTCKLRIMGSLISQ